MRSPTLQTLHETNLARAPALLSRWRLSRTLVPSETHLLRAASTVCLASSSSSRRCSLSPACTHVGRQRNARRAWSHTAMKKWRIAILGFGAARQKRVLERWTNPKPLQPIWDRAAI
jgi:hypothetical protein